MGTLVVWKEESLALPYQLYLSSALTALKGKLEATALRASPHLSKEGGGEPPLVGHRQSPPRCLRAAARICPDMALQMVGAPL